MWMFFNGFTVIMYLLFGVFACEYLTAKHEIVVSNKTYFHYNGPEHLSEIGIKHKTGTVICLKQSQIKDYIVIDEDRGYLKSGYLVKVDILSNRITGKPIMGKFIKFVNKEINFE